MATQLAARLAAVASRSTCRLVHYGRKTGKAYEVTIWFMVEGETVYLATANASRQWVRNVRARPQVKLRVAGEEFTGEAAEVTEPTARAHVTELVTQKYWYVGPLLWLLGLFLSNPGPDASFRVRIAT